MATSVTVRSFPFPRSASKSLESASATSVANQFVMDEHHFVRLLRTERKRTERSGKPFMLMLIDGTGIFNHSEIIKDVVVAFGASTRETDTLGWYETGSVLGVIFTELGAGEMLTIQTIVEKTMDSLRQQLDVEH